MKMRIYSDHLTQEDVRAAFGRARARGCDIWIESIRSFKPRIGRYGTEVFAESHHGTKATGHVSAYASGPRDGYPRAASWDDWGYVIAELYNTDPHARIGFYDSEADFVAKVRQYPRKGSELPFLDVLENIREYAE
jgi:hypothetical protein